MTTSTSDTRTSTRPSGSVRMLPTVTASALRERQTPGLHLFGARRPRHHAVGADQLEHARAREIGPDDARDAQRKRRLALEGDDRDGDGGARATDDLDGELRTRGREREEGQRKKRQQQAKVTWHADWYFITNW